MLLVSNWKAYVSDVAKAKALVSAAKRYVGKGETELVIVPPAPYLGLFVTKNRAKNTLSFGAQDLSLSTGGAATGEITATLLSELGVNYVIVGHSERRAAGETDETILVKMQHALANGLTPILCIGERERDDEAAYLPFLRRQIAVIFEALSPKERMQVIIAYEPIWAIGKGAAESIQTQDLHEMALYIRKVLSDYMAGTTAQNIRILYGGSVEPSNVRDLAAGSDIQGFLVGHASAEVASFTGLVKALT
jgi:triosephosphate isomerase